MVRIVATVVGIALLPVLLSGCPNDFGKGLGGGGGLLAPANLRGTAEGGDEIHLSWDDRATTEDGFRLEVSEAPFSAQRFMGVANLSRNATSHTFHCIPGFVYYFRIFAVTETRESEPSNEIWIRSPDVPAAPTGVSARTESSSRIDLTWLDVLKEVEYVIQRSADQGASWSDVGRAAADTPRYSDTGLSPDTEYGYRVLAVNSDGPSRPSAVAFERTATGAVTFRDPNSVYQGGLFNSLVVDADGSEYLAHYCASDPLIRYHQLDPSGVWVVGNGIDGGNVGGDGLSMVRDTAGVLHAVAHDRANGALKYYTKSGVGMWSQKTIDTVAGMSVGGRPRIVCDPATGALHVVYQARTATGACHLRYAVRLSGHPWVVDEFSLRAVLESSVHSLALDSSGVPHVMLVSESGELWHAVRPNPLTTSGTVEEQISLSSIMGAPDYTSLVVDAAGTLLAAFRGPQSRSLFLAKKSSGLWSVETIHAQSGRNLGAYCSLVLSPSTGRLHVAYYDQERQDLWYARKDPGGSWIQKLVDAGGDVGSHVSIGVDASDTVHFAYRDETNFHLKAAVGAP